MASDTMDQDGRDRGDSSGIDEVDLLKEYLEGGSEARTLGDFKIVREIGRGGMGTVYEAIQLSLNRRVALKMLPRHLSFSMDAVVKFQREAEAGGRQRHPGIVAVHALGEHEGVHYIAQELVKDGVTLHDRIESLRKTGRLERGYFRDTARLVSDVASALHHAHRSGVIHRDIKPSNILITEEGRPKVTDFGLAKVEDALALSRTGDFAGTPFYMSPEQALSRRIGIDQRTDIFSLGVTLYEMMTLSRPFDGKTSQEILKKIVLFDPKDPRKVDPRVPRDLAVICSKALEKDPARRYQTMTELKDDLERFLSGDVILARPAGPASRFWRKVKRNPVISVSSAVAIFAVVGAVCYVLFWAYPRVRSEKEKALQARKALEEQVDLTNERYHQIVGLSDVKILADLEAEMEKIWPAHPDNIPRMTRWLETAEKLVERVPVHSRTLETLRAKASERADGRSSGEGADKADDVPRKGDAGVWEFDTTALQWQHDTVEYLVREIESLSSGEKAAIDRMRERLAFAASIEERSIASHREVWDRAVSSIANREECPGYEGLALDFMVGFVPLGPDPDSGLWEFVHLQTGGIPERDGNGRLVLTEETGLVFVLIPGGTFRMGAEKPSTGFPEGSANADPQAEDLEKPVHGVDLKPFLISKYEMTQGQWLRFTGENPSLYMPGKTLGEPINLIHPVVRVSWNDCREVLHRLGLRFPTEAEWEYAARAGTTTIFWTGNEKSSLEGAANVSDSVLKKFINQPTMKYEAWSDGAPVHAPVGIFRANLFGLHDMHGNVWEWCRDSYVPSYESAPRDGSAMESSETTKRIGRGGSWYDFARFCRVAKRIGFEPTIRNDGVGLRPACSIP